VDCLDDNNQTDDGQARVDVRLVNESLWMTQSHMALLFQCSADNISLHLKNIYDEGERNREINAFEPVPLNREARSAIIWRGLPRDADIQNNRLTSA